MTKVITIQSNHSRNTTTYYTPLYLGTNMREFLLKHFSTNIGTVPSQGWEIPLRNVGLIKVYDADKYKAASSVSAALIPAKDWGKYGVDGAAPIVLVESEILPLFVRVCGEKR